MGIIPVLTQRWRQPCRSRVTERRKPGRPREIVRREPGTGAPLGTTPDDYQPTTRAMLEAARGIILGPGIHALTLRRVAEEAHVDVTTVTYHFGTRSGLLEALVGAVYAEPVAAFAEEIESCAEPRERARALFRTLRREFSDRAGGAVYAAILAEALRDERLRARLAALNAWTIRAFAEAVYGDAAEELLGDRRAHAAMQLLAAAVDGIEVHHHIDPDGYDLDGVLSLLDEMLPLPRDGGSDRPPQRSSARAMGCRSGSAGRSSMPIRASSRAFWKCFRFSASSSTIENDASRMASVISSPRIAGRQCMNLASGLVCAQSASFTWYGPRMRRSSFFSSSGCIHHQPTVKTTSACETASTASSVRRPASPRTPRSWRGQAPAPPASSAPQAARP